MQDALDDVQCVVLESILIAEPRCPRRRIGTNVDEAADDDVYFENSPEEKQVVVGMADKLLIVGLKELIGLVF